MVDEFKLEKLKKLREMGVNPYPYSYSVSHKTAEIIKGFGALEGKEVSVAGRIMKRRGMGKLYFIDLLDGYGKIQVLVREDTAKEDTVKITRLTDVGDIIGVHGKLIKTKKGEITVEAGEITMLSKSLLTLPEKFHGLTDTELRYRKRYLDLIMNTNVREFMAMRAKILKYLRDFLDSEGYIEFETPVLQPTYGGAAATPFVTTHNALGTKVFLRISDELYLKRLIIGGFEKVYEVSKDFRNEDIDALHNPEFTQIEFYESYRDYEDFMKFTEKMFSSLVKHLFGTHKVKYQGREVDFTPPFERLYWVEELRKKTGIDVSAMTDADAARIAKKEGLETPIVNAYHVADSLFDKYIKPRALSAYVRSGLPIIHVSAHKGQARKPKIEREVRVLRCGQGGGQLLLRAHRSDGAEEEVRGTGNGEEEGRLRGPAVRFRLPRGDRVRHASHSWHGVCDRQAGNDTHGQRLDKGSNTIPRNQAREGRGEVTTSCWRFLSFLAQTRISGKALSQTPL